MNSFRTRDVAQQAGIHRDTLLRWLREGRIPEPGRDRNSWRVFTEEEARKVVEYASAVSDDNPTRVMEDRAQYGSYGEQVEKLKHLDWDFVTADTEYLNHSLHPYPCKFIPQIPNTLIQSLSSVGETVLDPFCGSGTTLVEALRLNRNAIGLDANPIAALISTAKTTRITEPQAAVLREFARTFVGRGEFLQNGQTSLFADSRVAEDGPLYAEDSDRWISEWYDPHVIPEIAEIKKECATLEPEALRTIGFVALSGILVSVSRQDSDTRYVRREKRIAEGDTFVKFGRNLESIANQLLSFSAETNPKTHADVMQCDVLSKPEIGPVHLVVCSPPYPNAYSYHLYHRSRMLWLGMDPGLFKRCEIGSHRKYSRKGKNAANADTFRRELDTILTWLKTKVEKDRHICFVIGDSTIAGKIVKNDSILAESAKACGYRVEASISRNLLGTKKYFNPKIGKIRDEKIVILRNSSWQM
jgi:DNA modification methylase